MVGASTFGIIGSFLFSIICFVLLVVCFVLAIILMIKANKALTIWIRKNDDMQPPFPTYPPSHPTRED